MFIHINIHESYKIFLVLKKGQGSNQTDKMVADTKTEFLKKISEKRKEFINNTEKEIKKLQNKKKQL